MRAHVSRIACLAGAAAALGVWAATSCRSPGTDQARARSVILFLGDAAGLPTLSAAAIEAGRPQQLFIERMPHLGLMETSSASNWVTDSAAGMTALVTGEKTQNGVVSQSDSALRGERDGHLLPTILEHAEQRGLSTGVVTNSSLLSATPAACYAHVNDRDDLPRILSQALRPRLGDGVDVMIGAGRGETLQAASALGLDLLAAARERHYALHSSLGNVPQDAQRTIVLMDDEDFDLGQATEMAIRILSRNPRGYFLMVESDLHADDIARGLRRTIAFDALIERTVERASPGTLVIFAADHSFDLRLQGGGRGGRKGDSLLSAPAGGAPALRREGHHTAEEVLVAASGPGSDEVHGFFPNTRLFHIMMEAYGWERRARSNEKP